jgi:hypothetical protein
LSRSVNLQVDPAGERSGEFVDEGLLVDPAPLAADRHLTSNGEAARGSPERHHRLGEARREALDRAVADPGSRHFHLRAGIAEGGDRAERCGYQSQYAEPNDELHGNLSPVVEAP